MTSLLLRHGAVDVDVKITRSTFTAKEGEDYRLCVSTSKMIARDLVLNMKLTTDTADLGT